MGCVASKNQISENSPIETPFLQNHGAENAERKLQAGGLQGRVRKRLSLPEAQCPATPAVQHSASSQDRAGLFPIQCQKVSVSDLRGQDTESLVLTTL